MSFCLKKQTLNGNDKRSDVVFRVICEFRERKKNQ